MTREEEDAERLIIGIREAALILSSVWEQFHAIDINALAKIEARSQLLSRLMIRSSQVKTKFPSEDPS